MGSGVAGEDNNLERVLHVGCPIWRKYCVYRGLHRRSMLASVEKMDERC